MDKLNEIGYQYLAPVLMLLDPSAHNHPPVPRNAKLTLI